MNLYHATTKDKLSSIMKKGIVRGCPSNFEGMDMLDAVYLALNPNAAIAYAECADTYNNEEIVVICVNVDALNFDEIRYDWNNRCEYEREINSIAYHADIPADLLRVLSKEEIEETPEYRLSDFEDSSKEYDIYNIIADIFDEEVETNKERL